MGSGCASARQLGICTRAMRTRRGSSEPLLLHLSRLSCDTLPMPFLVVREPGRVACTIPLDETTRIGRDPAAELVLSDRQVSRHHAVLSCEGGSWMIND